MGRVETTRGWEQMVVRVDLLRYHRVGLVGLVLTPSLNARRRSPVGCDIVVMFGTMGVGGLDKIVNLVIMRGQLRVLEISLFCDLQSP